MSITENKTMKSIKETNAFRTSAPSSTTPHLQNHNLNIYMYSFEEILDLFDLNYDITTEDLKKAKKKVLMLHPDKSRLSSEYFLFYKKAFEIVVNYYENNNKQNKIITKENTKYDVSTIHNEYNKNTEKKINTMINGMNSDVFQEKFNELFEKNMIKTQNKEKNDWFYNEQPIYEIEKNISKSNINNAIENIKKKGQGMILYKGVSELYSSSGTNFYDDIDNTDNDNYISSDPFSKLKFDDLRKVHKDQTILAVGESDFNKVKTYGTVEQMNRERESHDLTPLTKDKSEKLLAEKQRLLKEKMSQKQHESLLITKKYEEKNKSILSTFLQLT